METKVYEHYTDYFNENSEIFWKKRNIKTTIIWLIIGIISWIIAFLLWFNYDAVLEFFMQWSSVSEWKKRKFFIFLEIFKYGSIVLTFISFFVTFFWSSEYLDKRHGWIIKFPALNKYIDWENKAVLNLFKNWEIDQILNIPTVEARNSDSTNNIQFWEDKIWKKYYVFLNYNWELFWTKIISEPEYSIIKPLVEENIEESKKLINQ